MVSRQSKSVWVQATDGKATDMSRFITSPWSGDLATFNMLVYGEPGEGKTPLLGTVVDEPRMMPALLINCDSGTLSIREREELQTMHLPIIAAQLRDETKKPVNEWDALSSIYEWLLFGDHNLRTVMLDGGTDLEQFCEISCLVHGIDHKDPNKMHDEDLSELADYRRIQQRMKRMYVRFRDMKTKDGRKINFIATAHEGKLKDSTGSIMTQPLYIGKGTVMVQSVFDIVGRLHAEEINKKEVRRLTFKPTGRSRSRSRVKELGEYIENPTMTKIADKIFGSVDT